MAPTQTQSEQHLWIDMGRSPGAQTSVSRVPASRMVLAHAT